MAKRKRYSPEFKAQIILQILKEEKTIAQLASENGIHVTQLNRWKKEALENLPQLFTDHSKTMEKVKSEYEKQRSIRRSRPVDYRVIVVEKNLALNFNREDRLSMVDWDNRDVPIARQTDLLCLNRSSLYYKPVPPS